MAYGRPSSGAYPTWFTDLDLAALIEIWGAEDNAPPSTPGLSLEADTGISAGDRITRNGVLLVTGLESGSSWEWSLDGGSNWAAGSGTSFELPEGSYAAGAVRVRQSDVAGNTSEALSTFGALVVD